jgi:hypothetical protein
MQIAFEARLGGIAAAAVGVVMAAAATATADTQYTVQSLGAAGADVGGTGNSYGYGINNAGLVVGNGHLHLGGVYKGDRGFLWQNGAQTTLSLGTQADGDGYTALYAVNDAGTAIGDADHYAGGNYVGTRGIVWHNGTLHPLQPLGTDATGVGYTGVTAMNGAGAVVGYAEKYVGGASKGYRPLVWQNGAQAELPTLGDGANGVGDASAVAVSASGVVAGQSDWHDAGGSTFRGVRPVTWQGGAVTPLPLLGTSPAGFGNGVTHAINAAGVVVGASDVYVNGVHRGFHAVRWAADGTPTDLGALGSDANGVARTRATLVNDAGVIAGEAFKYDVDGDDLGPRGVLWRGGQMFEMGTLGAAANGRGYSEIASDINFDAVPLNALGQLVGRTIQYGPGGNMLGDRATFMDEAGVTHFIHPAATAPDGGGYSEATVLTDAGVVYGRQDLYDPAGTYLGASAFRWTVAGGLVDVNTLIEGGPAANGWLRLTYVSGVNDLGQLVGYGTRLTGEERGFVLTPVPEPAALAVLVAPALLARRRRPRGATNNPA